MSENILVTVSGGKTSAFMAIYLKEKFKDKNLLFCFANTSKENEETLIFLDKLDMHFNLNIVWLEAVINPKKGKGTRHKIVDFKTAKRKGELFEQLLKKYGLPSKLYRHCTRELKEAPIHNYAKEIFGKDYITAVGFRADEPHRLGKKKGEFYPLAEIYTNEKFINDWWERQPFNLGLNKHEGNCDFCFLKSKKKRVLLVKEGKVNIDWWREMEINYGSERQPMFDVRNNLCIDDLVKLAELEMQQISLFDDISFDCMCAN